VRYKLGAKTRIGTFGDAGKIGLADARAKAFAWHAIIRDGRDPASEERRSAAAERRLPSVASFAREYIDRHAKLHKKSWREDERLLRHDVLPALGDLRIDTVTRRDIVFLLDAIRDRGAAVVANRALAVTRRMFAFAVERGVIEASPFVGVRASRETPRARTLSDDEIRLLWAATAPGAPRIETSTRLALRLLLLTGARATEVCGAFWDEINTVAAEWVIPAARTKNGREHRIPLSEPAMEIVQEAAAIAPVGRSVRRPDAAAAAGARRGGAATSGTAAVAGASTARPQDLKPGSRTASRRGAGHGARDSGLSSLFRGVRFASFDGFKRE
jgi:integrase